MYPFLFISHSTFVPRIDLQICLGNPFSKDFVGFSEWIDEATARGVGFPPRCLPALNESAVVITYDTGVWCKSLNELWIKFARFAIMVFVISDLFDDEFSRFFIIRHAISDKNELAGFLMYFSKVFLKIRISSASPQREGILHYNPKSWILVRRADPQPKHWPGIFRQIDQARKPSPVPRKRYLVSCP